MMNPNKIICYWICSMCGKQDEKPWNSIENSPPEQWEQVSLPSAGLGDRYRPGKDGHLCPDCILALHEAWGKVKN